MTALQPEHSTMRLSDEWKIDAACRGISTEAFYSSKISAVKQFCDICPVKPDCLEYALLTDQYGIWGGMSEAERRKKFPPYIVDAMREDYED